MEVDRIDERQNWRSKRLGECAATAHYASTLAAPPQQQISPPQESQARDQSTLSSEAIEQVRQNGTPQMPDAREVSPLQESMRAWMQERRTSEVNM